jgi:hypothetical protein
MFAFPSPIWFALVWMAAIICMFLEAYPPIVATHFFVVVEEDVHMALQRLRWAPQNFMGSMVVSLPHACIGTPPWKLGGAGIPPNGGWWHIILLCTSFLGHRRSYFSSPTQEVLPLTNLLSPQEKVLIFHPIGANLLWPL